MKRIITCLLLFFTLNFSQQPVTTANLPYYIHELYYNKIHIDSVLVADSSAIYIQGYITTALLDTANMVYKDEDETIIGVWSFTDSTFLDTLQFNIIYGLDSLNVDSLNFVPDFELSDSTAILRIRIESKADSSLVGYLAQNETITGNWVNTAFPWAENELVSTVLVESDLNTFFELQALVADKTLLNEEDVFEIDNNWSFTDSVFIDTLQFSILYGLDSLNIDSLNFIPDLEFSNYKTALDTGNIGYLPQDESVTGIWNFNSIQINPTASQVYSEGLIYYNEDDNTLVIYNDESEVSMNVGEELYKRVRNASGATIVDGTPVYITGATGQIATIDSTDADIDVASLFAGLATHDIENNSNGYITVFGIVRGLDTDGSPYGESWTDGDQLYISQTKGWITNIRPSGTNVVCLGSVDYAHTTLGRIQVHPVIDWAIDFKTMQLVVTDSAFIDTLQFNRIYGLDSLNVDSLNFVPDLEFATYKTALDTGNIGYLNQDESIAGNWINTTNPWANNEVVDALTITPIDATTETAIEAVVEHDQLQSVSADEHIAHSGVDLTAGEGLGGGGTIASTRTFVVLLDVDGGLETVDDSINIKLNGTTLSLSTDGLKINSSGTSDFANITVSDSAFINTLQFNVIYGLDSLNIDSLNFIPDLEMTNLKATTMTAGDGLSGGGDLSTNRTFDVNVDFDGGLETVDDSLNIKLDGATLTKSVNGVKVTDSTYQPLDGTLTAFAGLTIGANELIYGTGADAFAMLGVNATATNKFLRQVSSGVPAWTELVSGDISSIETDPIWVSDSTDYAVIAHNESITGAWDFLSLDVNDGNITNVGTINLDIIDSDGSSIIIGNATTNKITLTDNTSIAIALGSNAGDDFTIDGTGFVYEGDDNKVGIGLANPTEELEVNGNIESDNWELLTDYGGNLETALTSIGSVNKTTLDVNMQPIGLTGNDTVTSNIHLNIRRGYPLSATADTLNFEYGSGITAGDYQIFNTSLFISGKIQGEFNGKWYGAVGEGIGDDTDSLQIAYDLLKSKVVSEMYTPGGVYDYTTLIFYKDTQGNAKRGNFIFRGAGGEASAQENELGTTFNCTSGSGDGFVVNINPTPFNVDSAMANVVFKDFRLTGNTSGNLMKTDMVTKNSVFDNITVRNNGTGVAWYARSCFRTNFSNIDMYGDGLDASIGLFYDLKNGVGGQVSFNNISVDKFGTGAIFANETDNITGSGLTIAKVNRMLFYRSEIGAVVGYNAKITFDNCRWEADTTDALVVKHGAWVNVTNSRFDGSENGATVKFITGTTETDIYSGAKLSIDNSFIKGGGSSTGLFEFPDSSYASLIIRDSKLQSFNDPVFVFDTTYFGNFVLDNLDYTGIAYNSGDFLNHKEFLSPSSSLPRMQSIIVNSDTLDLSYRQYAPLIINSAGTTADALIKLPDDGSLLDLMFPITIIKEGGSNIVVIDAGTGNEILNGSFSAQYDTLSNANTSMTLTPMVASTKMYWRSDVNEIIASEISIIDDGSIITSTHVEGALQENRIASDLNTTHRGSSGTDHSLLGATPGTATASLALIVDASKNITLDGGNLTAGNIISNSNYVAEGYTTGRNVDRSMRLRVQPGGTPNTDINITSTETPTFNTQSITDVTNLIASETDGQWTLSADGTTITLNTTETFIGILDYGWVHTHHINNSSAEIYKLNIILAGDNLTITLRKQATGSNSSWLDIMDTGDDVNFVISYKTST